MIKSFSGVFGRTKIGRAYSQRTRDAGEAESRATSSPTFASYPSDKMLDKQTLPSVILHDLIDFNYFEGVSDKARCVTPEFFNESSLGVHRLADCHR